jgi:replication factor A1
MLLFDGACRFNNARSDGKFFSFDLLDKEGGEIRAVAFNEQADKFLNLIQIGNVYTLTKANLVQKKPVSEAVRLVCQEETQAS